MKSKFIILFGLLSTTLALGHGEDKPGPNGGFIRMPGAFHTEIVPVTANEMTVFLLDINWKNPTVKSSSLSITHQSETKVKAVCEIKNSLSYLCSFPKSVDITKRGKLIVDSQREGQKGVEVSYDLPLKHEPPSDGHESHH